MSTVLVIKAHPHTPESLSLTIGDKFIAEYKKSHPSDKVIVRDLYKDGVPPLNDVTMSAWQKQKFEQPMTQAEKDLLAQHEEWLNEFIAADKYVFINRIITSYQPNSSNILI